MSRRGRSTSALPFSLSSWSEMDSERRNSILLVGGITIVILLAIGLIGFGYYTDRVKPKHETVLTVGHRSFDYAYLERRVKTNFRIGIVDPQNLQQDILRTLGQIQEEEVTRQTAKANGYTATDAEIEAEMPSQIPGQHPKEPTPEELRELVRGYLLSTGYSLDEFREIITAKVLKSKMHDDIEAAVPSQLPHASMRIIVNTTEGNALNAKQQFQQRLLTEPEPDIAFALVAAVVSEDASKAEGGEKNWVVKGSLPAKVDEVAFTKTGASDIIETPEGYYLLFVREIQTQTVTADDKKAIVDRTIQDKQTAAMDPLGGTKVGLTSDHISRITRALAALSA
ncbi:MAG TPA: peptidylprolyl isomerase [Dehalococcoidia bacterium]|nr:peptidylprolyl isomerase [Dehalococcoidia bacterium]